ncbi:MAG: serine/threonine protein kinase [Myxococcus sp.]|nr:serine/threonine protein kinase [Myxococcus sp.]
MPGRLGRYELVRRLGHGGMGEVFLARVAGSSSPQVVLKRLLPHLAHDRELGRLFLNEAGVAARLVHPNVSRVLELGEADGVFFFTMEFVEGSDLKALGAVPLESAVRIVADAATALHAAQTSTDAAGRPFGIVHGDVSPKNLLVGVDGVTRLIDFGLGRLGRDEGSLGGTWEYMAPEHALDGVADAKTDQFSLGVVFWELLTGRRLYAGETDTSTLDQVVACVVTPPKQVNALVPEPLDALVMRMLARAPAQRFSDLGEVVTLLEQWLATQRAGDARRALAVWMAHRAPAPTAVAPPPAQPPPSLAVTTLAPLSPHETEALRQLEQFEGPLTLEQLEAHLRLSPDAPPVLDVAQSLVERGLLVRDGDAGFRLR